MGFEPMTPVRSTCFQDRRLKPLGHPSTPFRQPPLTASESRGIVFADRWPGNTRQGMVSFVERRRETGFIRPSRRTRIHAPNIPVEAVLPAPPGLALIRTTRYANRKCPGPAAKHLESELVGADGFQTRSYGMAIRGVVKTNWCYDGCPNPRSPGRRVSTNSRRLL